MRAYSYESVCEAIKRMADWQAIAICAVCAEKVAPIGRSVALETTWRLADECLKFAWSSVERRPIVEKGQDLIKSLESLPEWGCDDPRRLPFIVAKALDFTMFAMRASTSVSPSEQAERALSLLLEVTEDFDTAASEFLDAGGATGVARHLRTSEEESQGRLIVLLESASSPSREVVSNLRRESHAISELFERLLPVYCYCYLRG